MSRLFHARAYGCLWESEFPLPLFQSAQPANLSGAKPNHSIVQVSLVGTNAAERPYAVASGRLRFCADGLRYVSDDGTLIDVYGNNRVEISPGKAWNGEPPAAFYGTATAALLAVRGTLPVHGSMVELGGRAVLLCGHSGVGKSTLTAALITAGARLLSDDLSGIQLAPSLLPEVYSGRRAIRLFPDVARFLGERVPIQVVHHAEEAKVLVMPTVAPAERAHELAAVLILGDDEREPSAEMAGLKLLEFSFRRRAFRHLPGFERRVEIARATAQSVPVLALAGVQARSQRGFETAAEETLQTLAAAGITG